MRRSPCGGFSRRILLKVKVSRNAIARGTRKVSCTHRASGWDTGNVGKGLKNKSRLLFGKQNANAGWRSRAVRTANPDRVYSFLPGNSWQILQKSGRDVRKFGMAPLGLGCGNRRRRPAVRGHRGKMPAGISLHTWSSVLSVFQDTFPASMRDGAGFFTIVCGFLRKDFYAAVRPDNFCECLSAVSGSAPDRALYPAVVWRWPVHLDGLHAVFPVIAAGRLPVLAPAQHAVSTADSGDCAPDAADRFAGLSADCPQ